MTSRAPHSVLVVTVATFVALTLAVLLMEQIALDATVRESMLSLERANQSAISGRGAVYGDQRTTRPRRSE